MEGACHRKPQPMIPFKWMHRTDKSVKTESRLVVDGFGGRGITERRVSANGYEVSFGCEKKCPKIR